MIPRILRCRVCGNRELLPCVTIGNQYLSSIFPSDLGYRRELKAYPMDLVLCIKDSSGKTCGLPQLSHELDLSEMYRSYPYTSSSNSSMSKVLQDVAESGLALNHLKPGDLILDIGCNDGTLLSFFNRAEWKLLGIDAAHNIEPVFNSPNLEIKRATFFNRGSFDALSSQKAKLIFSIAMFYHLSDPVGFARDAADCLAEDGVWIIQMAYLADMLRTLMYDNIVHEHAGYYGIQHMQWIMDKAGLEIFDALTNDVYGGSFRIFVKKKGFAGFPKTGRYAALLDQEKAARLFDLESYRKFERGIDKSRSDLRSLLHRFKAEGKKIWAYGASTKGNTILQYCELNASDIKAAADSNPFKFGKFMIGSDIPIFDEEVMRRAKPDYLLALPYSFVDGFIRREQALIKNGTRFIVPLPNVILKPALE